MASALVRTTFQRRYFIRRRAPDRLELTQADDGDAEQPLLFVAEIAVLERYLIGLSPMTSAKTSTCRSSICPGAVVISPPGTN